MAERQEASRKQPISSLKIDLPKREEESIGPKEAALTSKGARITYEVLEKSVKENKLNPKDVADGAFKYLESSPELRKELLGRTQKFLHKYCISLAEPIEKTVEFGEVTAKSAAKAAEPIVDMITPPGFVKESVSFNPDPLKKSLHFSVSFRSIEDKNQRFFVSYDFKEGRKSQADVTYQFKF